MEAHSGEAQETMDEAPGAITEQAAALSSSGLIAGQDQGGIQHTSSFHEFMQDTSKAFRPLNLGGNGGGGEGGGGDYHAGAVGSSPLCLIPPSPMSAVSWGEGLLGGEEERVALQKKIRQLRAQVKIFCAVGARRQSKRCTAWNGRPGGHVRDTDAMDVLHALYARHATDDVLARMRVRTHA